MSKFRRLVVSVGFGAIIAVLPTGAFAFGALAIDSNHGSAHGFAHDYSTRQEAIDEALSECGANCTVVVEFRRGCAAYAADQSSGSSIYGWVNNVATQAVAESGARAECRQHGGRQCSVRIWGCE